MIGIAIAMFAAAASPASAQDIAVCDLGHVALHDLLPTDGGPRGSTFYAGAGRPGRRDLLDACPGLQRDLPQGYRLADDDARARANVHAPVPGATPPRTAWIWAINIPEVSADLHTAVVHFGYDCTGLCGGGLEARYVRTSRGWRREGAIRTLFVS